MAPRRHPLRSHILTLFRRGELVSAREAVLICDVTRQTVNRWLRASGIDVEAARMAYVARHRTRAQRLEEGKGPVRRPSKAQMRREIAEAMKRSGMSGAMD